MSTSVWPDERSTQLNLQAFQDRLGYSFDNPDLLTEAMRHRSWINESAPDLPSNERLEFLGDAFLGWAIAAIAFHRYTDMPEGVLTDLRKAVVNADALAEIARELNLGGNILLGRGEASSGGKDKVSILSDTMEAVIGAVLLDGGCTDAFAVVERLFADRLAQARSHPERLDFKSALQEELSHRGRSAPDYVTHCEGPDHDKRFYTKVFVSRQLAGQGEGRSKKAAEKAAAQAAYASLVAD